MEGDGVGGMNCDRKRTFKSHDGARRELKKLRKRVIDWTRLSLYWCHRHNGYHIGNKPSKAIRTLVTTNADEL